MQVHKLFIRATEEYGDNGCFELEEKEQDFLKAQIKILNQKTYLSDNEVSEAKGIFAILLYADKENSVETLNLNQSLKKLFDEVYSEFC